MMNMSSQARSRFVRKRKKPIGRAVATNENNYPMKIRLLIKIKMKKRKKRTKKDRMYAYVCTHRISDKQRQVSFFFLSFKRA
jgi:hypothetical protein